MENGQSEYSSIARQFAAVKKQQGLPSSTQLEQAGPDNIKRHIARFKTLHLLILSFFLWLL
jgi:hypothetical protein